MTDVVQAPVNVTITPITQQIGVVGDPAAVAVRLLDIAPVEVDKKEIVAVSQPHASIEIVAVGMQGPPGVGGGGGGGTVETYVCAVAIGGQRAIVTDAAGLAIYADNLDPTHANMATKITLGAAGAGANVQAQLVGRITEVSWNWAVGGTIYVGTNGLLTQTPPVAPATFSKPIAVAETPTRVLLIQEAPIML